MHDSMEQQFQNVALLILNFRIGLIGPQSVHRVQQYNNLAGEIILRIIL
jgi:hypothetical protein